jgi:hypothetical protein
MFEQSPTEPPEDGLPPIAYQFPPLPTWLARRLLRADEHITWVRGPWYQPWWERYLTNPALFLVALAIAGLVLMAGRLAAVSWDYISPLYVLAAVGILVGCVYLLALTSGFYTRLVVTNQRLLIVQGREVRRCWSIDNLPPSLVRYGRHEGGPEQRTVDLDALQTMLGSSSEQFADSKTIRAFGKRLDQIQRPDNRRS